MWYLYLVKFEEYLLKVHKHIFSMFSMFFYLFYMFCCCYAPTWDLNESYETSGLPWWLSGKESTCQEMWKIPWRRKWQAWKSYEQRSLAGYSPGVTRVRHDLVTKQQQQQWNFFPENFRILSHFLEIHWLPKAHSCGVHHFKIMLIPHFKQQMLTFMEYLLFVRLWESMKYCN